LRKIWRMRKQPRRQPRQWCVSVCIYLGEKERERDRVRIHQAKGRDQQHPPSRCSNSACACRTSPPPPAGAQQASRQQNFGLEHGRVRDVRCWGECDEPMKSRPRRPHRLNMQGRPACQWSMQGKQGARVKKHSFVRLRLA